MKAERADGLDSGAVESVNNGNMAIELREYIEGIFSWWREIILVIMIAIVLAGAFAGVLRLRTPPRYEASADVIMSRVVSSVNLVDTFRTVTEDGLAQANGAARREALVSLVQTATIAEAVIADLGEILTESERKPAVLMEVVSAEAPVGSDGRTISDIIRITVRSDEPEKAAAIANSWARQYVAHINSVFNQVPVETYESVASALEQAGTEYEQAQRNLEAFIADNRIDELQHQIDYKLALRTTYTDAQTILATSIVEHDRNARLKLFDDLVAAQTQALYQVFNDQVSEQLLDLTQFYAAKDLAKRQLDNAKKLLRQIESTGEGRTSGNELALQLLKAQVYATVEESILPVGLTVDLGTLLTEVDGEPLADVKALIETLESYLLELDEETEMLSQQLLAGEGYDFIDSFTPEKLAVSAHSQAGEQNELAAAINARYFDLFGVSEMARIGDSKLSKDGSTEMSIVIAQLTEEIQALRAELAAEESRQLMLTQKRQLALDTYNTLTSKVVELRLARAAANTEVRFGSPAVAPTTAVPEVSIGLVVTLAGLLGLIVAFFGATIAHLLGRKPLMAPS